MCGIVGYIGSRNATPILIEGLKRLEYRGYDSAGIAIINKKKSLKIFKEVGKIIELERSLPTPAETFGKTGIAHTRWATHGEPNLKNAHPHADENKKIAVVHNGIIENYKKLRKKLETKGYNFSSDTDSEVLAHLIEYFNRTEKNLTLAVQKALKLVEGTFGIAVINEENPNQIVAARKGSPLILGIGNNEFFIASDVAAIIIHTKKVIYLQDGEMVTVDKDKFELTTLENQAVKAKISEVDWQVSAIEKG
ncbi:MAG: glutamine--fructose-6-phosphate aminotransferase, partial [Candidatus Cloacimonetes bacterium]|nr:glutamine--fructose-6-phosphate aminotransferase [Candidatus Cloacimonadota bacterium]